MTTLTSRTCNRFFCFLFLFFIFRQSTFFGERETECVWQTAMYLECRRTLGMLIQCPCCVLLYNKKGLKKQDYECSTAPFVFCEWRFVVSPSVLKTGSTIFVEIKTRNEQQYSAATFLILLFYFYNHFWVTDLICVPFFPFFVLLFRFNIVVNLNWILFIF